LLLGALDGSEPNLIHTREPYERFEHFNSAIDAAVRVEAEVDYDDGVVVLGFKTPALNEGLKLRVEPSQLLYGLDRAAYVEILESLPSTFEVEEEEEPAVEEEPTLPPLAAVAAPPVTARIVKSYAGRFDALRSGLKQLLTAQGAPDATVARVLDSLLAAFDDAAVLDWQLREPMRARALVALKRVLKAAGPKHPPPDKLAAVILQWFIENEPGSSKQGRSRKSTRRSKEVQR
jgi:hypothetical protein